MNDKDCLVQLSLIKQRQFFTIYRIKQFLAQVFILFISDM